MSFDPDEEARDADWRRRFPPDAFPGLYRPGDGPHNRVAATLHEQFARVFKAAQPDPLPEPMRSQVVALVRQELKEFVRQLPKLVKAITKRKPRRRAS